ncbi:Helicase-like transcription factor [Pseudocercospora fuligena]|uniref:Helicase-like transcription factor n=1 Tax=Pseudocercospora fuligena TaxID=685502 RepID=A0A8H6R3F0_9PEZI|nr:Helicase-like transcription factor [Pseudocercospora fuligena]
MDKRSALSCDSCRSRKLRCIRLRDGSCQKCVSLGRECTTSNTKQTRAYYQTSKKQYELLSTIVQHYFPGLTMDAEDLRKAVSTLPLSGSQASIRPQFESHDPASQSVDTHSNALVSGPISSPASEMIDQEFIIRDAANLPRLDVGSGWAAFLRRVYARHSAQHPSQPIGRPEDTTDGSVPKVRMPNVLPDVESLERAVAKFFSEINSTLYIMVPEAFGRIVEGLYTRRFAASNACMTIVLAIYALMADSASSWFHQACLYLDLIILEGSLESIQAIMILMQVLCRLVREERHAAWILLGSAVRIARSRGLDRHPDTWTPEDVHSKEVRSRVYWALYTLDTDLTFSIGAPPELNLPVDETVARQIPVLEYATVYIPPGYTSASANLSVIIRRIAHRLYSKLPRIESPTTSMTYALGELTKWWDNLPITLRPDGPIAPEHFRSVAYLHRRYVGCRFQITRSCLLSKAQESSHFAQECILAHEVSVSTITQCHERGLLSPRHYFDMTHALGTGIVLLLRALKWPNQESMEALEKWISVIEFAKHTRMGQLGCYSAKRFVEILQSHLSQPAASRLDSDSPALYLWTGFDPLDADANFEELLQSFLKENTPLERELAIESMLGSDTILRELIIISRNRYCTVLPKRVPSQTVSVTEKLDASEDELKAMPMAAKPDCIKTEMLPYQLQALQWLLDQESPKLPELGSQQTIQLWKADRKYYTNLASGISTQTPGLASGGILADDMGLGKTLQMISLVASEKGEQASAPTLVVAPVSVLSNWSGQAQFHTHNDRRLSVYTYHASGRVKMESEDFSQYDIVLTTYGTLASDFGVVKKGSAIPERKLRSSGLHSVEWRRIILDEGHSIRNPATKAAAAAMGLIARSRWVLTGTPIVNSLKDLFSLLRFVGITGGLDQLETFNAVLVRPLKSGSESANNLLQAIMRSFTLRRRKDMAFIDLRLPKLDEYVHNIDFTRKEQERYNALTAEAKGLMTSYDKKKAAAGQSTSGAYNHLLEVLLRMRQCCNHWQLCGERVTNLLAQLEASKNVELTPENKKALQDVLRVQIESSEDCAICLDTLHQPVITTCGHAFGRSCIEKVIETQQKCPMCRAPLKDDGSLVEPANEYGDERADDDIDLTQSSSKVDALVKILAANQTSGNKTIVFSQWTSFLDIVKTRLDQEGYKCCRLDGTMNVQQRDKGIRALGDDAETGIMLASLGASAVGLNLTAANIVVLCDTWWAPAIEDQAVDRVHRLGQKKEVKVFRLVMNNTIEQHTLDIQKEKRKLMMMAFSEQQNKRLNARAGRIDDIRRLLA